jgi:hypothetical protein
MTIEMSFSTFAFFENRLTNLTIQKKIHTKKKKKAQTDGSAPKVVVSSDKEGGCCCCWCCCCPLTATHFSFVAVVITGDEVFSSSEVMLSSVSASTPPLLLSDSEDDEVRAVSLAVVDFSSSVFASAVSVCAGDVGGVTSVAVEDLASTEERMRRDFPLEDSFFSAFCSRREANGKNPFSVQSCLFLTLND